jgi:hypothetical protein
MQDYEDIMREKFGNPNLYNQYDMSHYTLRRDPMVFKYHRSQLKSVGKNKYEDIKDKYNDYIYPKPTNLQPMEDGIKVIKSKQKNL